MTEFNPFIDIDSNLDKIESDFSLCGTGMDKSEPRVSTGLLIMDLIMGGGIVPGSWTTLFGPEQSCKSTAAMTIAINLLKTDVPVLTFFDFENSSAPDYIENIMQTHGINVPIEKVFGIRDKNGNWVVRPRIRYYPESIGEKFFNYLAKLQRVLPDKVKIGDKWWYIYPHTKANQSYLSGKYDKQYFKQTNKFRIPAENGALQALVIVDSYPAMMPESQDTDDPSLAMATQARMFSEGLRRVKGRLKNKKIAVIGVNQLRFKPATLYGDPAYEPGGEGLKFYCFSEDTLLQTDKGLIYAFEYQHINPDKLLGAQGLEKPTIYTCMGLSQLIEIELAGGFKVKGKPEHHVLSRIVDVTRPQLKWISLQEIVENHKKIRLLVVKGHEIFPEENQPINFKSNFDFPQKLGVSLAKVLGYLLSTGLIVNKRKISFKYDKENHKQNFITNFKEAFLDIPGENMELINKEYVQITSKEINSFLFYTGLSDNKIPWVIRQAKREEISAFLATFYSNSGYLEDRFYISHSFKEILQELQVLLLNFKIFSEIEEIHPDNIESYLLAIDKNDGAKFKEIINPYLIDDLKINQNIEYKPELDTSIRYLPVKGINMDFNRSLTYDTNMPSSTVMTNGIVSHNSDVRLRLTARSIPHGKGQVEEEDSVTGDGVDQYRYIHIRAQKNKLSTPYLDGMARVWISDRHGKGRGFCPVWDTHDYLLQTGQISGKRNAIKFNISGFHNEKSMKWYDFKTLIIGSKQNIIKVCKSHNLPAKNIRAFCKKQLASGEGVELFYKNKRENLKEDEL